MDESMGAYERRELHEELVELFKLYGLAVAVGMTARGVAIRSQDPRVDASNLGPVTAQPDRAEVP